MYRRLRYLREITKVKQIELCKLIGVVDSQYSKYESEYVTIPIKHLNILCNYFDVSLDYIFEFTDTKKYKNNKVEIDKIVAGNRLKEFRKEHKLTQKQLSNYLNASFTTVSSYERGVNIINTDYLYTLCKDYNISADYLLGRVDNPKYLK